MPRAAAQARTRRQWMRSGAGAAAWAAGGLLTACADRTANGAGASSAAPAVTQPVTELTFMPWWIYWTSAGKAIVQEGADLFGAKHKGLRLTALPGPQGGGASTTGVIADMLAGTGPDVVGDCCGAWVSYLNAGAFANLDPYFKQDNIDTTAWATGQLKAMRTTDGQFGLPIYHGPVVFACNLDLLDQLGVTYPDPQWTHQDAAALWTQCAGPYQVGGATRHRYGANFWWQSHSWYAQSFLLHGFGGAEMDATHTQALFAEPGSIAAGNWVYPLLQQKVLGPSTGTIADGSAAFETAGGWSIPRNVTTFGTTLKWAYYPVPKYPEGRSTFANNDFWGLSAASTHLDEAWMALRWLTYEDDWQRFCMKATLLAPCKVSLWAEFEAQLTAAAPLLKDRGLEWFRDAAEGGYGYPQEFFRYNPTTADKLIGQVLGQVFDAKLDVAAGFQQVTQQLDALESAGKITDGQLQQATKTFPTAGPEMAPVPAGV